MMITRRSALLGGVGLVLAKPAGAAEASVTIDNFTFTPAVLMVAVGTMVTWTNEDDIPHTVVDEAAPKVTKSPPLDTGDHYSRMFDRPGEYGYFCSLHPHMRGKVVVK